MSQIVINNANYISPTTQLVMKGIWTWNVKAGEISSLFPAC